MLCLSAGNCRRSAQPPTWGSSNPRRLLDHGDGDDNKIILFPSRQSNTPADLDLH